jgi:hypothetical protein
VTCQRIARERIDKHLAIRARNNRKKCFKQQSARQWSGQISITWLVFSVVRPMPSPKQQNCKHVYNNRCVLGPCRRFIGDSEGRLQSVTAKKPWVKEMKPSWKRVQESSAVESTRTRIERVLSELWRLIEYRLGQRSTNDRRRTNKEEFIVILSASFYVEIHCSETTIEDGESWCVCSGELDSV